MPILNPKIGPVPDNLPVELYEISPPLSEEDIVFKSEDHMETKKPDEKTNFAVPLPHGNIQNVSVSISPLRTYHADIAEALGGNKMSMADIALAEQEKRRKKESFESAQTQRQKFTAGPGQFSLLKNKIFLAGAAVFILSVGIFVLLKFSGVFKKPTDELSIEIQNIKPIILAENQQVVEFDLRSDRVEVLKKLSAVVKNTDIKINTISHLRFISAQSAPPAPLKTEELFKWLAPHSSPSLPRALSKEFMFGVHFFNGNQPFLIIPVSLFEVAFSQMFAWEEYMILDLGPVFGMAPVEADPHLARDLPVPEGELPRAVSPVQPFGFEDVVLFNKDVRGVRNEKGEIQFLYSFIDRQTLVITSNERTFKEILDRGKAAVVR